MFYLAVALFVIGSIGAIIKFIKHDDPVGTLLVVVSGIGTVLIAYHFASYILYR